MCNQVFAVDLLAHLPVTIKAKIAAFDDAARMTVPASETFEVRMGAPAHQPACIAQLGSWASTAKAEKVEFKKAVAHSVAAIVAAMPLQPAAPVTGSSGAPASSSRPPQQHQGQRGTRPDYCMCCERAGRPTGGHSRETCQFYRCKGCGVVAPGHIYRNCPNPALGGPCPPHSE